MGEHKITKPKNVCVFLNRDGVLNKPVIRDGRPYPPARVEKFELYDDVLSGCKRLKEADFLLVVVSNQPDVARGTQSRATVETINKRLADAISVLDHFVSTPVKNTATVAIAENQNRECYFMLPDS